MLLDELVERQWPLTRDWLYTITHVLCLAHWKYCSWLCTARTDNVAPNCVSSLREVASLSPQKSAPICLYCWAVMGCRNFGVRSESILSNFERRCEFLRLNSVGSRWRNDMLHWWNDPGRGKWSSLRETRISATLSTTDRMWTDTRLKPSPWGERPAVARRRQWKDADTCGTGTTLCFWKHVERRACPNTQAQSEHIVYV